jgi:hypothetical protein
MSIDEFGLGGWWPRPDHAALGALDHLPAGQWPMLAARWLAAGFDSPLLRQLAELRARDTIDATMHALDLMPEAMRSIGFDPAPADEKFTARCQRALDIVQHDLDVTGYGQYRMRASIGQGWPATVFATLPDGSYWSGGEGMSRRMDGSWLLRQAAGSASAALKEVHEIEWPACAVHGGHPDTSVWAGEEPVDLIDEVAWWQCTNTGHPLAPVGQLTAKITRTP